MEPPLLSRVIHETALAGAWRGPVPSEGRGNPRERGNGPQIGREAPRTAYDGKVEGERVKAAKHRVAAWP